MPRIQTETTGAFGEALRPLDTLVDLGAAQAYKEFYSYFRDVVERRLESASLTTPYAESSIGTRQPFSHRLRRPLPNTGDAAQFGIDRGAFMEAITGKYTVKDGELTVEDPLPYLRRLEGLFKIKGPMQPEGLFHLDGDDLDVVDDIATRILEKRIEEELD